MKILSYMRRILQRTREIVFFIDFYNNMIWKIFSVLKLCRKTFPYTFFFHSLVIYIVWNIFYTGHGTINFTGRKILLYLVIFMRIINESQTKEFVFFKEKKNNKNCKLHIFVSLASQIFYQVEKIIENNLETLFSRPNIIFSSSKF